MNRPDPSRYGPAGPSRGARLLGLLMAGLMIVLGGLWAAQSFGLVGGESNGATAVLGPLLAGFGVALAWVCVRPAR